MVCVVLNEELDVALACYLYIAHKMFSLSYVCVQRLYSAALDKLIFYDHVYCVFHCVYQFALLTLVINTAYVRLKVTKAKSDYVLY